MKNCNNTGKKEADKITTSIAKLKMRLKNAKDMMLDGEFSAGDYKAMKIEIEQELEKMNREEMQIRQGIENYDTKIDDCLDLLLNLDKYYVTKNTEVKQKIIGSMFPEKLTFKNNEYRTTKTNEAVELICPIDKGLGKKKGGKKSEFSESSLRVEVRGMQSNLFCGYFESLMKFKPLKIKQLGREQVTKNLWLVSSRAGNDVT